MGSLRGRKQKKKKETCLTGCRGLAASRLDGGPGGASGQRARHLPIVDRLDHTTLCKHKRQDRQRRSATIWKPFIYSSTQIVRNKNLYVLEKECTFGTNPGPTVSKQGSNWTATREGRENCCALAVKEWILSVTLWQDIAFCDTHLHEKL